ncbi:MAG: NfeD family protein [Bacteroidota bacterium]|nr:MAG: NfeD family protein [Bacteroidota bacterium]
MAISVIIILILIGIVLLLIEFLVIPGVTIAGIAGTALIIGGVVSGYIFHGTPDGHYIMLATTALIVILFVLAFKTKTWQRMGLSTSIDSHIETAGSDQFKVGEIGKSISRLAPIGKVMIHDMIIEARSMGGYIDSNVDVVIVHTEKNKIFVEPK